MTFQRKQAASSNDSKMEYDNLTEGEHEGVLIYVADCGTQLREYQGEVKPPAQQIALCFEILGSTVTVDGKELPRIIWSKPFNIFGRMDSKSNEFAMFKAFVPTAKEDSIADWESVLGKPVNVIIKHHKKDADTTYDNVAGITSIPKKYLANVGKPVTTEFSIAGCEDADSPAIQNLFGLAKFIHDKRVVAGSTSGGSPEAVVEEETFSADVPF